MVFCMFGLLFHFRYFFFLILKDFEDLLPKKKKSERAGKVILK